MANINGNIPVEEAKSILTSEFMGEYLYRHVPKTWLLSKFPTPKGQVTDALTIAMATRKQTNNIAEQSMRGDEGNMRQGFKSEVQFFKPPFYKEHVNIVETDVYVNFWNSYNVSSKGVDKMVQYLIDELMVVDDEIERAKEYQISQFLSTGVVSVKGSATGINFGRITSSTTTAAQLWTIPTSLRWSTAGNAEKTIKAQCDVLVKNGYASGGEVFDIIVGDEAWAALKADENFDKRYVVDSGLFRFDATSKENTNGMTVLAHAKFGTYMVRFVSYKGWGVLAGSTVDFIGSKDAHIIPTETFKGYITCAGVPRIMDLKSPAERALMKKLAPSRAGTHIYSRPVHDEAYYVGLKCAPMVNPLNPDCVGTMKGVVA